MIRTKIKHLYFIPLALILATLVIPLFPQKAEAAEVTLEDNVKISLDLKWINRSEISLSNLQFSVSDDKRTISEETFDSIEAFGLQPLINNLRQNNEGNYKDGDLLDNDSITWMTYGGTAWNYKGGKYYKDKCGGAKETVLVPDLMHNTGNNEALIRLGELIITTVSDPGECDALLDESQHQTEFKVNIGDEQNRDIWFRMNSDQELERVDNGEKYTRQTPDNPNKYTGPKDGDKFKFVELKEDSVNSDDLLVGATFETSDVDRGAFDVKVQRSDPNLGKSDTVDPDSISPEGQPEPDCEVQMFNPLTWLICPLINGAATAVNELDNAITSQLTIETEGSTSVYDEANSDAGLTLFNIWGAFRYISLGILVIIGLIMIISQAMSFGVFDAYTIKKVLPKILIGVIGISVSWYLCKFAIDIFNDLGIGVRSLLYGPFKEAEGVQFDDGATALLVGSGGVALAALGIVGALSFVLTALMAVVIAFGILVFRQIIIMLLVVTAPIAIVCWILPNTEKVWKMWWDFFSKALIVFPIIALFIAGGRVIAQLAMMQSAQSGENDLLATTIAFIAYFGPYFALPAAFRMAGGALATVGGFANNRSKGAFDRLKNFRGERQKNRIEAFRNAGLYNEDTRRGRFGNALGGWMFDADERIPYYAGKSGGKLNPFRNRSMVLGSKIEHAAKEQTIDMFKTWNNDHDANDKFFAAMGGSMSDLTPETAKKLMAATGKNGKNLNLQGGLDTREKFEKAIEIMSQSDDSTERIAATALSRNMAPVLNRTRDGNGYADIHGAAMLGLSAHGFGSEESMVELANKIKAKHDGHNDFAESMLVFSEVNGSSGRKAGYSHSIDKDGSIITGKKAGRDWARAASKGATSIAGLKKGQAKADAQTLVDILAYSKADGDGRKAIEKDWEVNEGLSPEAIENRKSGFEEKAKTAEATLYALTHTYSGGATDTIGAIQNIIEDAQSKGIINTPGEDYTDEQKAAVIAAQKAAGAQGALANPGVQGPGIGGGGI